MFDTPKFRLSIQNRLLSILPVEEVEVLQSRFEPISFSPGKVIFQAGDPIRYCYFPNNGMISLLSVTEYGRAIEVGFTGYEGIIGLPALLGQTEMPYQALVQAPTDCIRVELKTILHLFRQNAVFHDAVLGYFYVVFRQIAQTCVCNHFHMIEARLCRWLTVMCDRSGNRHLRLTQEFLAHMLGVQRTSIGMIAASLQKAGIIGYSRGKIEIIDYDKLRNSACECYSIIKEEQRKFLKDKNFPDMSDNRQT